MVLAIHLLFMRIGHFNSLNLFIFLLPFHVTIMPKHHLVPHFISIINHLSFLYLVNFTFTHHLPLHLNLFQIFLHYFDYFNHFHFHFYFHFYFYFHPLQLMILMTLRTIKLLKLTFCSNSIFSAISFSSNSLKLLSMRMQQNLRH